MRITQDVVLWGDLTNNTLQNRKQRGVHYTLTLCGLFVEKFPSLLGLVSKWSRRPSSVSVNNKVIFLVHYTFEVLCSISCDVKNFGFLSLTVCRTTTTSEDAEASLGRIVWVTMLHCCECNEYGNHLSWMLFMLSIRQSSFILAGPHIKKNVETSLYHIRQE